MAESEERRIDDAEDETDRENDEANRRIDDAEGEVDRDADEVREHERVDDERFDAIDARLDRLEESLGSIVSLLETATVGAEEGESDPDEPYDDEYGDYIELEDERMLGI